MSPQLHGQAKFDLTPTDRSCLWFCCNLTGSARTIHHSGQRQTGAGTYKELFLRVSLAKSERENSRALRFCYMSVAAESGGKDGRGGHEGELCFLRFLITEEYPFSCTLKLSTLQILAVWCRLLHTGASPQIFRGRDVPNPELF